MKGFLSAARLAFALTCIPRLFATLFLIPIILSLLLVYAQLIATGLVVRSLSQDQKSLESGAKQLRSQSMARQLVYGDSKELPPLRICRWIDVTAADGTVFEKPPVPECAPDKLDAALRVVDPEHFAVAPYQEMFSGNVERLHVCRTCQPHVVIGIGPEGNTTQVYSVWGLLILSLVQFNDAVSEKYAKVFEGFDQVQDQLGHIKFFSAGFLNPIDIRGMKVSLVVVFNIALLIVMAMWLALRAHRKVLDYFARSGALLPMVAATGNNVFYGAIWILTGMRVLSFLAAAIPVTLFGLQEILTTDQVEGLFLGGLGAVALWLGTLIAGLALAALISSIAELKHRHSLLSFFYRYVPIVVCSLGMVVWSASFLSDAEVAGIIRNCIAVVPIVGMGPVLLAPVFEPPRSILLVHAILAFGMLYICLRHNARWFAAHLEDL